MKKLDNIEVEKLAATFHEIYQREARRQGNVRHADKYEDLPENIKEFDRVLARYVLQKFNQPEVDEKFINKWQDKFSFCTSASRDWRYIKQAIREMLREAGVRIRGENGKD